MALVFVWIMVCEFEFFVFFSNFYLPGVFVPFLLFVGPTALNKLWYFMSLCFDRWLCGPLLHLNNDPYDDARSIRIGTPLWPLRDFEYFLPLLIDREAVISLLST